MDTSKGLCLNILFYITKGYKISSPHIAAMCVYVCVCPVNAQLTSKEVDKLSQHKETTLLVELL